MHLSFATANLYQVPFDEVLVLIAEAGYSAIELDLFWERKEWAMAQHLRDVSPAQIGRFIRRSGLQVASIHDGGGVLEDPGAIMGYINPALQAVLDATGSTPICIVFHTPHVEGAQDAGWWERIEGRIAAALHGYRREGCCVCVENTPPFAGYTVPLTAPRQLAAFAARHDLNVTLDTTHYAQMGVNVLEAASILRDHIRSVHLSDYRAGATHVFVGEGELNLAEIIAALDRSSLRAVTVECSLALSSVPVSALSRSEKVDRMCQARLWVEQLLDGSAIASNKDNVPKGVGNTF